MDKNTRLQWVGSRLFKGLYTHLTQEGDGLLPHGMGISNVGLCHLLEGLSGPLQKEIIDCGKNKASTIYLPNYITTEVYIVMQLNCSTIQ